MRRVLFLASLVNIALLSACASPGGPVPMGKDTYMLSNTGAWSWSAGAELKGELFREADAFCRGQGKNLMPESTATKDANFSQFAHAELQFRCLADGDPELKRPTMVQAPNVVIENRTK